MAKVCLFGYFGAGNFGDEWTLASFLRGWQQCGFDRNGVLVLSRHPTVTQGEHEVIAVPRRWHLIFAALRESECLIGCGGSLLQDVTSVRSLVFYSLLIWTAKGMGKKVVLLGQGLGPLRRPTSRRLARTTLSLCDLVTFRDPISAILAQRLGANIPNCSVTADLTFLWDELPPTQPTYCAVVNLRPTQQKWEVRFLARALRQRINANERVLLLPLQPGVDEVALHPLSTLLPSDWEQYKRWRDGLKGLARAPLVVAMRLHALIAACVLGVPFLGLSYDPKVEGVLGEVAADQILPLTAAPADIADALRRITEEWEPHRRDRIADFVAEQRRNAHRNFALLSDLLSR